MADDTPQPEPKRRLRWYQYSLRSLFLVTMAFAVWLGWICHKANRQRKAVEAIEELDGLVMYDYEFDADGIPIRNPQPPGPAWFRNLVERLDFYNTRVTDAGLVHLQGLTNLEVLWLDSSLVSDDGVNQLQQALPNCTICGYAAEPAAAGREAF